MTTPRERFDAKVERTDTCWLWTASVAGGGYGTFGIGNKRTKPAHRLMWEWEHGPIPPGMFVCHKCDVKRCVRPDHLFLGTPQDNTLDMVAKKRNGPGGPSGEQSGVARLTETAVMDIRARYAAGGASHATLAAEYGVCAATVAHAVRRLTWKHIP